MPFIGLSFIGPYNILLDLIRSCSPTIAPSNGTFIFLFSVIKNPIKNPIKVSDVAYIYTGKQSRPAFVKVLYYWEETQIDGVSSEGIPKEFSRILCVKSSMINVKYERHQFFMHEWFLFTSYNNIHCSLVGNHPGTDISITCYIKPVTS